MNANEAMKNTGWQLCEFKADGEDECSTCGEVITVGGPVYYQRTCYEHDEGEYHCEKCPLDEPRRRDEEMEQFAEYLAEQEFGA